MSAASVAADPRCVSVNRMSLFLSASGSEPNLVHALSSYACALRSSHRLLLVPVIVRVPFLVSLEECVCLSSSLHAVREAILLHTGTLTPEVRRS